MKRVQVDYSMDGTMVRDVRYADGPIRTKIHRKGRRSAAYLKLPGETLTYADVARISIADVNEPGQPEDMR